MFGIITFNVPDNLCSLFYPPVNGRKFKLKEIHEFGIYWGI